MRNRTNYGENSAKTRVLDSKLSRLLLVLSFRISTQWFGHRREFETVPFPGEGAAMRAFMRTVDKRCPTAAGALESKPFHKGEFHGFRGMPGDDTGVVLDDLTVAIVAIIGVSKIDHRHYSTQGNVFQRRSHQLRVRRRVSFVSQVR